MNSWYDKSFKRTAQPVKGNAAEAAIEQAVEDFSKQMDSKVLPMFYSALQQSLAGIVQRYMFTVSQMMKDSNLPEDQALNMNALYLISVEAAKATANNKGAEITNTIKSSSVNNQNLALWRRRITNLAMQHAVPSNKTPTPAPSGNAGAPGIQGNPGQAGAGGSSGSMQSSVSGQAG